MPVDCATSRLDGTPRTSVVESPVPRLTRVSLLAAASFRFTDELSEAEALVKLRREAHLRSQHYAKKVSIP